MPQIKALLLARRTFVPLFQFPILGKSAKKCKSGLLSNIWERRCQHNLLVFHFFHAVRQFGLQIWVQEDKNPFAQYLQLNSRNWTNFYFWWNPALMPMWKICVLSQICEDWWSQMNHQCSPSAIKFSRLSGLWMTIDNYIKFTRLLFLSGRISYMRPAELELSRMIKGNCKVTQQGW